MKDLIKFLEQAYGLEDVRLERIPHPHDLRPTYIVKTGKDTYLLKKYDWFDEHREKGLQIVDELSKTGYPTITVFKNCKGLNYSNYGEETYALFEYIPNINKLNWQKPSNWAFLLGNSLGKLHSFKPRTRLDSNYESVGDFLERFHDRVTLYEKDGYPIT